MSRIQTEKTDKGKCISMHQTRDKTPFYEGEVVTVRNYYTEVTA